MAQPMGYYHKVAVSRNGTVINAGLACRVGTMAAKLQMTIFGEFSSEVKMLEWGTEALRNGDIVTYNGKAYRYQPFHNDQDRPPSSRIPAGQAGILTQEKRPKSG